MGSNPDSAPPQVSHLEREERKLWRLVLAFVLLLGMALAAVAWERLAAFSHGLSGLAIAAAAVVVIFALDVSRRRRELAELRGQLRGLQQGLQAVASDQVTQLAEAITRSQQGYRELIDSLDELVLALNLDGTIRRVNRRVAELLGRSFPDLVGHSLSEFVDRAQVAEAERGLPRLLERRHWEGVVRLRLGTGRLLHLDCSARPILEDGRATGISVLARDISHEQEREARFSGLFETLQEAVYFTSPEGRILDGNPALARLLGYDSKQELLGVNVADLYVDPQQRAAELRELQARSTIRGHEVTLRRKDGKHVICLDTAMAVWDTAGQLLRYQGTLLDITEQRAVEARLREQEEFRRRLVENFPDVIIVLDHEARITFVSPRVEDVLGYAPESLLGRRAGDTSHPDKLEEMQQLFAQLIRGERKLAEIEFSARHADGSGRSLRAMAGPLYDGHGAITGVVASLRDVSELKRLQEQVLQSERLAAIGQMIDGFAHELNNPLTAILAACEVLEEKKEGGRELELLHQQARRAAEVVQNLLFFSRPPAPGVAALDLNDLVRRALKLRAHSLKVSHVSVDFLAEPKLPAASGDPNQLMQVLVNLLMNAEQAIHETRPRGTLRIRLGSADHRVWATFQDDGPGIPEDALPRIFDPFFSTKRPGGGTGLGLSVCLSIVREHGGDLRAEAAPGGGTVFTLALPTASKVAAAERKSTAAV